MKAYVAKMSFLAIITSILIIFNLCFPEYSLTGAKSGLLLCGNVIIPSLFPFCCIALFCFKSGMVNFLSEMISPITKRIFHINGDQFCVFLMSFLAGYPVGMKLIKELAENNKITKQQAQRMALYCVNPGPAFILVAIGQGMLNDNIAGIVLLVSNIIATLVVLLITEQRHKPEESILYVCDSRCISDALVSATASASASVFGICGWVILFSSVIAVFSNPFFPSKISIFLKYISEVTTAAIGAKQNIPLISAILSFSGISVHCQIYSVGNKYAPPYIKFLVFRLFHAAISSSISFAILKILGRNITTISNNVSFTSNSTSFTYTSSVALIFMCIVFMTSILETKRKIL